MTAERPWKVTAWAGLTVALLVAVVRCRPYRVGGDAVDYVDAARDLTGPSRFPPGFPLLLAPFTESVPVMQVVTLTVALLLVGAIWWAAVKLGGWCAGAVASVLMLLAPELVGGGAAIMSDKLGTLLVVGGLLALLYERPALAGVLTGLSGWVRLVHVVFVAALPRRAWAAAGAVVGVLVGWQVLVKGSLLGYSSGGASWSAGNVTGGSWYEWIGNPAPRPNVVFFPRVLLGLEGGLIPPGVALVGLAGLWRFRDRFAAGVVALTLAVYLPYAFQSPRFMLPACALLVIYAAAFLGHDREGVPAGRRGDTRTRGRDDQPVVGLVR